MEIITIPPTQLQSFDEFERFYYPDCDILHPVTVFFSDPFEGEFTKTFTDYYELRFYIDVHAYHRILATGHN